MSLRRAIAAVAIAAGMTLGVAQPSAAIDVCSGVLNPPKQIGTAIRADGLMVCSTQFGGPTYPFAQLQRKVSGSWRNYGNPELVSCPPYGINLVLCTPTDGAPGASGEFRMVFFFATDLAGTQVYYGPSATFK